MSDPAQTAVACLADAFEAAARGRVGATLADWEEAIRAHLQAQMALAVMRLSQGAPAMLEEGSDGFERVVVDLPLPDGTRFRFDAALERLGA